MSDLAALMALRVQGIGGADRLAAALGTDPDEARRRAAELVAAALVCERSGRLAGYVLTPEGLEHLDSLLSEEGLRSSTELKEHYDRFVGVDRRVKEISFAWQDRQDPSVVDELVELHDRVRVCVGKIGACADRYAPYPTRLDGCLDRLLGGDLTAFTKPAAESYHQIWWELHQDLLLTLGLQREE